MRLLVSFPFLFTASFAFSQKLHELKTDVVLPFFQFAHLSYEFNPEGRLGAEANLWYSWAEKASYYVPPPVLLTTI